MSVMDLPPPPPPRPPVGEAVSGTVIGAPPQGLVCLQGVWQPYTMVQGQMVVQFQRDAGSGCSTAGVVPSVVPPPPPMPPTPTTPKVGTSGASSSTPGGTPVPPWTPESGGPPPPAPPTATSQAASSVDAGSSEEPSKLVTKLPVLASARGGDAAVIAGDWLAQLEPAMSSLSPSAASWWRQLMDRVKGLYTTWLESAPVARLSLRQSVLSQRPLQDKHQRVEQRAAVLLLESLPEELRHEVVSVRAVTVEAMIFLVHCAYQPGGAGEKAHLLQFLTAPDVGTGLDGTLQLARKWVRRELQLVLPDPSLLCRGLDRVISTIFSGNKHPSASFRIASFKLERQLDYKASFVDAEDYAYLVVGELEAALLAQPLPAAPKLARMEEGKGNDDAGKGKAKGKGKRACWAWQDGSGCKYGQSCMFAHDALGAGRCWNCGSSSHLKPQCPYLGQGGAATMASASGGPVGASKPGWWWKRNGGGKARKEAAKEGIGARGSSVAVHLFCGKDRAAWKSRAEAAHVITVDQAEDIMADDTYAALLDLALTGKIKMIFGVHLVGRFRLFAVLQVRMEDLGLYGLAKEVNAGVGTTLASGKHGGSVKTPSWSSGCCFFGWWQRSLPKGRVTSGRVSSWSTRRTRMST